MSSIVMPPSHWPLPVPSSRMSTELRVMTLLLTFAFVGAVAPGSCAKAEADPSNPARDSFADLQTAEIVICIFRQG